MKILIVRVSSLGDVVHNMPMIADILRRYPNAEIDWVVEEAYADLVRLNRGVRRVIPFALRRWRKSLLSSRTRAEIGVFRQRLRDERYDLVFDTQGLLKTALVMRMSRLTENGQRVGLANGTEDSGYEPLSRLFHTKSVAVERRTHAVQRGRLVAAGALHYAVDNSPDFLLDPPSVPAPWLPRHPYAAFFHATARAAKRWDDAGWAALARYLQQRGLSVLLPWGSESEREAAQQLARAMPNAIVLPKLSMMEAVLLAQRATLAVGVDTGLTHIAAAYKRPTVELYCDSPRWKTEGNWAPCIINLGDSGQRPSPAEVQAAAKLLLDQSGIRG